MKPIEETLRLKKQLRIIGFDDAPFQNDRGSKVNISGIVCSGTRFEGMLWGQVEKDGWNATDVIIDLLKHSKFFDQIHAVLIDGIAVGGFNIIDLSVLSTALNKPCIAVMRKPPNLDAIKTALHNFSDCEARWNTLLKAGEIYDVGNFHFQVKGCQPTQAVAILEKVTDTGNVPEALRLAHLIGSAIMTGQSSNSA